jgi:BON domain
MNKKMMFAFVPVVAIALWGCPANTPPVEAPVVPPVVSGAIDAGKDKMAGAVDAGKDKIATGASNVIDAGKDKMAGAVDAGKSAVVGAAGGAVSTAVNAALSANKDLAGIKVRVDDKGVFLTGTVASDDLKTKAGTAAQGALTAAKSPLKLMNQLIIKAK